MNKSIRALAGLLLAAALLVFMSADGYAYTGIDPAKTASLTIRPSKGDFIGSSLTIYRVADVVTDSTGQRYALTDEFENSGADLSSPDEMDKSAKTLSSYASGRGIIGITREAGSDGSVAFDKLRPGLYLVVQQQAQPGEIIVSPFLVSVPMQNDNGEWVYDVCANPKSETLEVIDLAVKKVWNDGNDDSFRPSSVTVTLYRDGEELDVVTLSDENDWSYIWTQLEKSDSYSVQETDVTGYEAAYSQNGYLFIVTNTPKLPQTGQLNWPVPLLACAGVLLFAVGWGLVFFKRKTDA